MIKHSKILLVFLSLLISKTIYAYSSASLLISKTAFNNYDFNQVLYEYEKEKNQGYKDSYLNELISAVVTEDIVLAGKIANKILLNDSNNQEAKLVSMVKAINDKMPNIVQTLRFNENKDKNDLIEFLIFQGNSIKKNNDISNAFLEIVKSSYSNYDEDYSQNYNFLLFYTSLSILINQQNHEATFIKAQLLQIINDYFFAETTYLKIPKNSEYYIDAQINIAYNYSIENVFSDAENKIVSIVNNNKENYQLNKIVADFYRVQKKYNIAIDMYSDLLQKNPDDLWYLYYLRGICYERSGNWTKAEVDFLQSLKIKSDSPDVLNYLAYGWIERNVNIQQSFDMLTKAYNTNPDSHYILDSLAWAHFKKKNYNKAAELMEKVIDMVPGEAISLDHLGDIYFAMNRKREAFYFWKQAKDLAEPEDDITDKIIEKLRVYDAN